MAKAYDHLDCEFIRKRFLDLNSYNRWTGRLMQCISTISFNVIANGRRSQTILPERGFRQGIPIFSYIFIICVEYLGRYIHFTAYQPKSHLNNT